MMLAVGMIATTATVTVVIALLLLIQRGAQLSAERPIAEHAI